MDETGGAKPHEDVGNLTWSEAEKRRGKSVHVKKFPKGHRVKLFRLVVSTEGFSSDHRDYVVTNDVDQDSADDTQEVCAVRWKIEEFHREAKQVTGIEQC